MAESCSGGSKRARGKQKESKEPGALVSSEFTGLIRDPEQFSQEKTQGYLKNNIQVGVIGRE